MFDKSRGCRGNEAKDREWVCRLCRKVEMLLLTKGTAREDELVMPQGRNTVSDTQPQDVGRGATRQRDGAVIRIARRRGCVYQKHASVRMRQLILGEASTASRKITPSTWGMGRIWL